jgi:hypothetical protein
MGLKEMATVIFQIDNLSQSNLGAVQKIEAQGRALSVKTIEIEQLLSQYKVV